MGPTRRAFHLRLFTRLAFLFVALLGLGGAKATTAAASEALLATLQPATASEPAVLSFYSAGGALVHQLTLPVGVNVAAATLAPDGRHWLYVSGAVSGPEVAEA